MKKILVITPHLSTGGLPQFLLEKIQILIEQYDVYLVEWVDITGGIFVVQRKKLVNLLKDKFFTLPENKREIFEVIDKINPDIVHFEEFSETFVDHEILSELYNNKNYYITETTHGTSFNVVDKLFIPDKLMFVSKGNFNQYRTITKDCDVIEYPEKFKKRFENLLKLDLDPSYKHVLNVGLFTQGKNQGEIFELAKKMTDYKVKFHFIGNQAGNFQDYWKPLMDSKPDNCIIWGEKENVKDFYSAMDLFLYTSKWENRPLSVLEALDHDMKVLMHNLENYANDFARFENVEFLTNDFDSNINLIKQSLDLKEKSENIKKEPKYNSVKISEITSVNQTIKSDIKVKYNISAYHILTDIDTEREIRSVADLSRLEDYGINYKHIISKRWKELPPKETCAFPDIVGMEPPGKLTPAHYGCYLGHRKAFETGYQDNPDYMLIFECDCVLDVSSDEFINKVNEAIEIVNENDLFMFSFGFHNGQSIISKHDTFFKVFEFIGAHAYLIPRKSYEEIFQTYQTAKWNVADLFMGNNFRKFVHGIFPHPITKQAGGISILENLPNEDRY